MAMHQSRLYRIAYAYLHNEGDALEAIQESTYRAYRKLKTKEPSCFGTWLIRILLNYCADERKRKNRYSPVTEMHEPSSWDRPEDPDLAAAVSALDPDCKQIIILSYFEGFSSPKLQRSSTFRLVRSNPDFTGHLDSFVLSYK